MLLRQQPVRLLVSGEAIRARVKLQHPARAQRDVGEVRQRRGRSWQRPRLNVAALPVSTDFFQYCLCPASELGCKGRGRRQPQGNHVIDSIVNLLFRCRHHRLSRPITMSVKPGEPAAQPYVVCLDCGKQFGYDLERMRLGKVVKGDL
jgi:hypothetical protein